MHVPEIRVLLLECLKNGECLRKFLSGAIDVRNLIQCIRCEIAGRIGIGDVLICLNRRWQLVEHGVFEMRYAPLCFRGDDGIRVRLQQCLIGLNRLFRPIELIRIAVKFGYLKLRDGGERRAVMRAHKCLLHVESFECGADIPNLL